MAVCGTLHNAVARYGNLRVSGDWPHHRLDRNIVLGLDKKPVDEADRAFAQTRNQAMSLIVRGVRSAHEIAPEISWIIHDLDPDAVITDVQALAQVREDSLAPRRNTAVFFSIFAVLELCHYCLRYQRPDDSGGHGAQARDWHPHGAALRLAG